MYPSLTPCSELKRGMRFFVEFPLLLLENSFDWRSILWQSAVTIYLAPMTFPFPIKLRSFLGILRVCSYGNPITLELKPMTLLEVPLLGN